MMMVMGVDRLGMEGGEGMQRRKRVEVRQGKEAGREGEGDEAEKEGRGEGGKEGRRRMARKERMKKGGKEKEGEGWQG